MINVAQWTVNVSKSGEMVRAIVVEASDYREAIARELALQARIKEAESLLHTASISLAAQLSYKESPRREIIKFLEVAP